MIQYEYPGFFFQNFRIEHYNEYHMISSFDPFPQFGMRDQSECHPTWTILIYYIIRAHFIIFRVVIIYILIDYI